MVKFSLVRRNHHRVVQTSTDGHPVDAQSRYSTRHPLCSTPCQCTTL